MPVHSQVERALLEEERAERIGAFATQAMASVLSGASRELPAMTEDMTRSAVNGALDAALDPARQERLGGAVNMLVSTSVKSIAAWLALRKLIAAFRTSWMSRSMLPLVSSVKPRCSGMASPRLAPSSGSPSEKYVIVCGLPSSRSSKSSGFNPVMGVPCLSVRMTENCTRSTPALNRCCAVTVNDPRAATAT